MVDGAQADQTQEDTSTRSKRETNASRAASDAGRRTQKTWARNAASAIRLRLPTGGNQRSGRPWQARITGSAECVGADRCRQRQSHCHRGDRYPGCAGACDNASAAPCLWTLRCGRCLPPLYSASCGHLQRRGHQERAGDQPAVGRGNGATGKAENWHTVDNIFAVGRQRVEQRHRRVWKHAGSAGRGRARLRFPAVTGSAASEYGVRWYGARTGKTEWQAESWRLCAAAHACRPALDAERRRWQARWWGRGRYFRSIPAEGATTERQSGVAHDGVGFTAWGAGQAANDGTHSPGCIWTEGFDTKSKSCAGTVAHGDAFAWRRTNQCRFDWIAVYQRRSNWSTRRQEGRGRKRRSPLRLAGA